MVGLVVFVKQEFPNKPPQMRFVTEMWHPNSKLRILLFPGCPCLTRILVALSVYTDGKVCISILHDPEVDQYGYEDVGERWLPVHTVETIVSPSPAVSLALIHSLTPFRACDFRSSL
jgi:ubiquitin-protein ligase